MILVVFITDVGAFVNVVPLLAIAGFAVDNPKKSTGASSAASSSSSSSAAAGPGAKQSAHVKPGSPRSRSLPSPKKSSTALSASSS